MREEGLAPGSRKVTGGKESLGETSNKIQWVMEGLGKMEWRDSLLDIQPRILLSLSQTLLPSIHPKPPPSSITHHILLGI